MWNTRQSACSVWHCWGISLAPHLRWDQCTSEFRIEQWGWYVMRETPYSSKGWRNCLCSVQKQEQGENEREGEMLSVLQHARRVLHKEQSLVVLCVKENFVYFAQGRTELAAWKTKQNKPQNFLIRRIVQQLEQATRGGCTNPVTGGLLLKQLSGQLLRSFSALPLYDLAE